MPTAHQKASSACRVLFWGKRKEHLACEAGAEIGVASCMKETGVKLSGIKRGRVVMAGTSLGFFNPCEEPCPSGTERVTIRKFKAGSRQVVRYEKTGKGKEVYEGTEAVCVCRLDPSTRKKQRDESVKVTRTYERGLKPFGSEKKPVHLRRCYKVDDRGRCKEPGAPLVISRSRS
jgi:hypothetical protein